MVQAFGKRQGVGDQTPLMCGHTKDAVRTAGYVLDMGRKNDTLFALCQLIGTDAADVARRNFVSIKLDPNYTDGKGNVYPEAITHVALTPVPVIPDQEHFKELALSHSICFRLSHKEEPPMAKHTLSCSDETLAQLHEHVPGLKDAPDDEKLSRIAQHFKTLCMADMSDAGDMGGLSLSMDEVHKKAIANRSDWKKKATEDLTAAQKTINGQQQQILSLSASTPRELDPYTAKSLAESWDVRGESLVRKGFDPASVRVLRKILVGDDQKYNHLALSHAANTGGDGALALAVVGALEQVQFTPPAGGAEAVLTRKSPGDKNTVTDAEWAAGKAALRGEKPAKATA
jgi:hypothetical protein